MFDLPRAGDAVRLLKELRSGAHVRPLVPPGTRLDPQMELLTDWQTSRLKGTYADFLASSRYGPACRFFLSDVYASRDFADRNHDVEHMHQFLGRFLPARMLGVLTHAIELHYLTAGLDRALCDVLVNVLGVTAEITVPLYAEAYRLCDNYDARVHQINLIVDVGRGVDRLSRLPLTGATLRVSRGPAHMSGWSELYDFLERGFRAFKQMGDARKFLRAIQQREMRILNQIYAHSPDPFSMAD